MKTLTLKFTDEQYAVLSAGLRSDPDNLTPEKWLAEMAEGKLANIQKRNAKAAIEAEHSVVSVAVDG